MKSFAILSIFVLLVALVAALPAFAGQTKSPVCHMTSTYDFGHGAVPTGHVITIADPAIDSHIAHGDATAYVETALPDGTAVCAAEADFLGICYTNETNSIKLVAPLGVFNNMEGWTTTGCVGPTIADDPDTRSMTLAAPDLAAATTACTELGEIANLYRWVDPGYNTPSNWWFCAVVDGPV